MRRRLFLPTAAVSAPGLLAILVVALVPGAAWPAALFVLTAVALRQASVHLIVTRRLAPARE